MKMSKFALTAMIASDVVRERPSVKLTEQLPVIIQLRTTAITKTEPQPKLLPQSLRQAMPSPLQPLAATRAQLVTSLTCATARAATATA